MRARRSKSWTSRGPLVGLPSPPLGALRGGQKGRAVCVGAFKRGGRWTRLSSPQGAPSLASVGFSPQSGLTKRRAKRVGIAVAAGVVEISGWPPAKAHLNTILRHKLKINPQDDFYLNLVAWSGANVLAVGLGTCVYLWSACTSRVTKLCDLGPGDAVRLVVLRRFNSFALMTASSVFLGNRRAMWGVRLPVVGVHLPRDQAVRPGPRRRGAFS